MNTIYTYIEEQEVAFKTKIPLEDGWFWNFRDHIRLSFLYKHAQFETKNDDRELRPFKNIARPILNVQYRTEGFDVKDIEIYVDNPDDYHKSFLVKKWHDRWARENAMDTFIDDLVQSFVDYGGALVKKTESVRPEVVDLRTLAFCDQTDMLSGPFAIKHYYTPSQLKDMAKVGWGTVGATISIDDLVLKAETKKQMDKASPSTKTPGRYIEVYEIHNVAERDFNVTSNDDTPQIYICAFYSDQAGNPQGVTLFKNPEPKLPFKLIKRDPIPGRALGYGGMEELFEAQIWTNFDEIAIAGMLEQASKIFYLTTDQKFKNQTMVGRKNGSVLDLTQGSTFDQLNNVPRNLSVFENKAVDWHQHAMEVGAASELSLGKEPASGTPFKSVETQLVEGNSLHLWRQGRLATFMDEIYRDWIIPLGAKELTKGTQWLAELSGDEIMEISDTISRNEANARMKKALIDGNIDEVTPQNYEQIKTVLKDGEIRKGKKRFLEILKDEMKDAPLSVYTNIVGKQKNLALLTDKLVNYVRQLIATPEVRQDPGLMKHVNEILESSGLSPIVYGVKPSQMQQQPPQQPSGGGTQGLKDFSKAQQPA